MSAYAGRWRLLACCLLTAVALLVGCAAVVATPTAGDGYIEVAPGSATWQAIQDVLDLEAVALRNGDADAFRLLVNPDADAAWLRNRLSVFRRANQPVLHSLESRQIATTGDWALAAVWAEWDNTPLITALTALSPTVVITPTPLAVDFTNDLRYFRRVDGRWRLTSPDIAAWGPPRTLTLTHVALVYYPFDEAYVVGAAARLDAYLEEAARYFGVPLAEVAPFTLRIYPWDVPGWNDLTAPKIMSPASLPGARIYDLQTNVRAFAWGLYEQMGHRFVAHVVDAATLARWGTSRYPELGHNILSWQAHAFIQDEVYQQAMAIRQSAAERLPLAKLLAPDMEPPERSDGLDAYYQQMAALTFVVETYGRGSLKALLRAAFVVPTLTDGTDWQLVVRLALWQNPADVEARWQAWAAHPRSSPLP